LYGVLGTNTLSY